MDLKSKGTFRILAIASFIFSFSIMMYGQSEQKAIIDSSGLAYSKTIIPVVFYLPETSLAFGATGILSVRDRNSSSDEGAEDRASQILLGAIYTLKNQLLLISTYELYQQNRKIRYKGELGYFIFFYNYYGIGANSSSDDLELYDVTFPRIDFNYSRQVYKEISLGTGLKYDRFNITNIKQDGLLDRDRPIGYDGGTKANFTALLFMDSRDNINTASEGYYLEATYQKSLSFLGSSFNNQKIDVDLRYYMSLRENWIFANQLWVSAASEGTPFFDLAHVSTAVRSRGFDDRRFINRHVGTWQSELRFPIYWRIRGSLMSSYTILPETWNRPFDQDEKFTYGVGVRFLLNEKDGTNFRIDVARGDGKIQLYLTANEAF